MEEEDLLIYFIIGVFEKRKPNAQLSGDFKRDIKTFLKPYNIA